MRTVFIALSLILGTLILGGPGLADSYPSPNVDLDVLIRNPNWDGVVVTAHNGGILEGPQDTIIAFTKSYNHGADIIEMDVRITADNELIAFHDDTFTWFNSTGSGRVRERTLDYVRSIEARSWIWGVPNQPIPTLREGFRFLREHRVCGNIEPKDNVEAEIIRLAVEEGVLNQILIQAKSPDRAAEIRRLHPQAAMIARIRRESDVEAYAPYRPEVAEVDTDIPDTVIARLRALGARVQMNAGYLPFDLGTEQSWRERIARGVNVVLTDLIPNMVDFVRREAFNMGSEAKPRAGAAGLTGLTIVDLNGPASAAGAQASLRVLMASAGMGKLKVFRDRGGQYERVTETALVPLREGLNVLRVDGPFQAGDLVGLFLAAGDVEADSGGSGQSAWIEGDVGTASKDSWTRDDFVISLDGKVR